MRHAPSQWLLFALVGAAQTQTSQVLAQDAQGAVSEVVITADRIGLLEEKPSAAALGLDMASLDAPRASTVVSDLTLQRYGVTTIDGLVAISPSTYTASFYGVPGSLNIRGTLAENYFDGFKRVENRGTYATPIGDAAELEIVRGPPNLVYGPGKVGGLVNFIPKTAEDAGAKGEVSVTAGSYQKAEVTAEGGAPITIGPFQGGIYGYADVDSAHSYYHGIYPKRQTAELSSDFNLPTGWTTAFQAMVYHSDGDVQTAGWNRLTQSLIDNGVYTTGRNTTLSDLNGDGRLSVAEAADQLSQLTCFFQGCTNPVHQLTQGVGLTTLSPRTVQVSAADTAETTTYTTYVNAAKALTKNTGVKLELFYDDLNNEHFVSYGFAASYQTYIAEGRLSYSSAIEGWGGWIKIKSIFGASDRYTDAHLRESFNSGIINIDRRDLSIGATPTDTIASPFQAQNTGLSGYPWEMDVHSNIRDAGAFATSDITLADRLMLIAGARLDDFNVDSNDLAQTLFSFDSPHAHGAQSKGAYSLSLSYKSDWGVTPYYTYNQSPALELDQASDLPPSTINAAKSWLSTSYLSEAGVKVRTLRSSLIGSLAVYRQTRTQLVDGPSAPASVQGTVSKGVELEIRYVASKNLSFTYAGDIQHTEVKGPDTSFTYIPPFADGVLGVNGYGGSYAAVVDTLPGRAGNYADAIIPHSVNSLYATLGSDPSPWGEAGATLGVTHASKTAMLIEGGVVYPAYWIANLSAYYRTGPYTVSANIDNLFGALYFTPNADPTYANVAALPSTGREWRVTLKRAF